MNQFDYNEPPEIQAAAQRVRPSFLDADAIEERKASFSIERFRDPEIVPMPAAAVHNPVGKLVETNPIRSTALDRTLGENVCRCGKAKLPSRPFCYNCRRYGKYGPRANSNPTLPSSHSGISARDILDRLSAGKSMVEIGEDFGITAPAVSKRLKCAMKASPQLAVEYQAMIACPCGKRKAPSLPNCNKCGRRGGRGNRAA